MDDTNTTPLAVVIPVAKVLEIIARTGARYPHDVFPDEGASDDCKAAKAIRFILEDLDRSVRAEAGI